MLHGMRTGSDCILILKYVIERLTCVGLVSFMMQSYLHFSENTTQSKRQGSRPTFQGISWLFIRASWREKNAKALKVNGIQSESSALCRNEMEVYNSWSWPMRQSRTSSKCHQGNTPTEYQVCLCLTHTHTHSPNSQGCLPPTLLLMLFDRNPPLPTPQHSALLKKRHGRSALRSLPTFSLPAGPMTFIDSSWLWGLAPTQQSEMSPWLPSALTDLTVHIAQ